MTAYSLSNLPWRSKNSSVRIVKNEKLLRHSQRHLIKYVPSCAVYFLLSICCLGLFWVGMSIRATTVGLSEIFFFTVVVTIVMFHHWLFHAILSENTCDVILTNKRMLFATHHLWLNDSVHDMSLDDIKAVEVHMHGILQHICNYGDLWFDTGGSTAEEPNQTITFVPKVQVWADDIARALKTA